MSLIEVMITMGIASGLVLAVMEAVTLTQKEVKSAQVSNDWTSLINNIRQLLTDNTKAAATSFSPVVGNVTATTIPPPSGTATTPRHLDTIEFETFAQKVATNGTGLLKGGNTRLYSGPGFSRNNQITVQILRE